MLQKISESIHQDYIYLISEITKSINDPITYKYIIYGFVGTFIFILWISISSKNDEENSY